MTTQQILLPTSTATYFVSDEVLIENEQSALDLMAEAQTDAIILHEYNFSPDFFDLSTRKLGDVMQKFANYRVNVAIIGDFSRYSSKVLPAFIAESNRQKKYLFVHSLEEAVSTWS